MKSRFTFFVTLYLISLTAAGQVVDIDLLWGPNLVWLRSDFKEIGYESKITITKGLGVSYYFNNRLSASLKFLIEDKGAKGDWFYEYPNEPPSEQKPINFVLSYDYLSFPITARYSVGDKIKLMAEAGVYVSHLVRATGYIISLEGRPTITEDYTRDENQNRTDIGLSFGSTLLIPIKGRFSFKASLLHNLGLKNIKREYGMMKTNSLNLLTAVSYRLTR